ncbi:hypothetical protein V8C42DRAFT_277049 [Trichoderma barbatum]
MPSMKVRYILPQGMSLLASQPTLVAPASCAAQALVRYPIPGLYNHQQRALMAGEEIHEWTEDSRCYRRSLRQGWVLPGLGPHARQYCKAAAHPAMNASQQGIQSSYVAVPSTSYFQHHVGLSQRDFGLPAHQGSRIPWRVGYISKDILVEVAVQMTCLLYFSSADELKAAEVAFSTLPPLSPPPSAIPTDKFRCKVYGVVHNASLTPDDVYLALLLIYRRRMMTRLTQPQRGREGDFELLCTALILSHKTLHDITFTNGKWAHNSGLDIKDIHRMEIEFLSNIQYSLLVTRDEWEEWLNKLVSFQIHAYSKQARTRPTTPAQGAANYCPSFLDTRPLPRVFNSLTIPGPILTPTITHTTVPVADTIDRACSGRRLEQKQCLSVCRKRRTEGREAQEQVKRQNVRSS